MAEVCTGRCRHRSGAVQVREPATLRGSGNLMEPWPAQNTRVHEELASLCRSPAVLHRRPATVAQRCPPTPAMCAASPSRSSRASGCVNGHSSRTAPPPRSCVSPGGRTIKPSCHWLAELPAVCGDAPPGLHQSSRTRTRLFAGAVKADGLGSRFACIRVPYREMQKPRVIPLAARARASARTVHQPAWDERDD